jgi:uncharacterized membrane protein YqaE (UPF0057 family)
MKNCLVLCICLFSSIALSTATGAEIIPSVTRANATDSAAVAELNSALADYKVLSKKEKKSRFREARQLFRQYRVAQKSADEDVDTNQILLAIIAILLPPLAIYLKERTLSWKFWASAALLVTGIIFLSALPFLWIIAAGVALLVVFDVL